MASTYCTQDTACDRFKQDSTYFRFDQNPNYRLLEPFQTPDQSNQDLQNSYTNLMNQIQAVGDQYDTALHDYQQNISTKDQQIQDKSQRIKDQQTALVEKSQILQTRDRMLQVSQERNVYKQKLIYSLIALIGLFIVLTVGLYFIGRSSPSV